MTCIHIFHLILPSTVYVCLPSLKHVVKSSAPRNPAGSHAEWLHRMWWKTRSGSSPSTRFCKCFMGASGQAGFSEGRDIENIVQRPREVCPVSGSYGARRGSNHAQTTRADSILRRSGWSWTSSGFPNHLACQKLDKGIANMMSLACWTVEFRPLDTNGLHCNDGRRVEAIV